MTKVEQVAAARPASAPQTRTNNVPIRAGGRARRSAQEIKDHLKKPMNKYICATLLLLIGSLKADDRIIIDPDSNTQQILLKLSDHVQALFTFGGFALKPSDDDPAHRDLLTNKDGSLVGFTLRPATQTGFVYLFLTRPNGDVTIMKDINNRLKRLFRNLPGGFADDCIVLENIEGRVLSLTSNTHSKTPMVNFRVRVGADGDLVLLKK